MINAYSFLALIIIQCNAITNGEETLQKLWLDDAYLTLNNRNYPNMIELFGNKIICEGCDLVSMLLEANVSHSKTRVINTKYAYDLEVHELYSNGTSLCQIPAYKFEEYGTYILDVIQSTQDGVDCSIRQVGELSNYLAPAIVGIAFVVLYVIVVQIAYQLYYGRCSSYFHTRILRRGPINDETESIIQISGRNQPQDFADIPDDNYMRGATGTSKMPLTGAIYSSSNRTQTAKSSSKRLRALDTFRGFALMVMIFVNYGGMFAVLQV